MPAAYTDAALKAELQSPAYAGMTPFEAAATLNAPSSAAYRPAPMTAVLKWGAASGVMANIQDAAAGAGSFAGIAADRSIAIAVQYMLQGGMAALDVTDPAIVGAVAGGAAYTPGAAVATPGMLDALAAAAVLTADQKDALIALGAYQASRVQVLFGDTAPAIDADRVMAVLRS